MSRFNVQNYARTMVRNNAGGLGYKVDPYTELAGILFTNWCKGNSWMPRVNSLILECGPEYALKAAIMARNKFGMRSITHYVGAQCIKSKVKLPSELYQKLIYRPDDILEILALTNGKVSHAAKRAFARKLEGFSEYQLAKYKNKGELKLVDAINICHPRPNEQLTKLYKGTIGAADTWESNDSSKEFFEAALREGRLGYKALLMNLRNMAQKGVNQTLVAEALVNRDQILKGKIFPFEFLKAYGYADTYSVRLALETACDISFEVVPELNGKTVVLLDTSGSMTPYKDTAALFASSVKNAKVVVFDTRAASTSLGNVGVLRKALTMPFSGGGTDFRCAYNYLRDRNIYADRIILISDMQHWVGGDSSYGAFLEWKESTGSDPDVWTIDLAHEGVAQFPGHRARQLFGFSEKIFELLPVMENNGLRKLIDETC